MYNSLRTKVTKFPQTRCKCCPSTWWARQWRSHHQQNAEWISGMMVECNDGTVYWDKLRCYNKICSFLVNKSICSNPSRDRVRAPIFPSQFCKSNIQLWCNVCEKANRNAIPTMQMYKVWLPAANSHVEGRLVRLRFSVKRTLTNERARRKWLASNPCISSMLLTMKLNNIRAVGASLWTDWRARS